MKPDRYDMMTEDELRREIHEDTKRLEWLMSDNGIRWACNTLDVRRETIDAEMKSREYDC